MQINSEKNLTVEKDRTPVRDPDREIVKDNKSSMHSIIYRNRLLGLL